MFDLGTSEDDVDIDIKYCGYCHTDIHLINNDWGFTTYPAVGGHEVSTSFYFFLRYKLIKLIELLKLKKIF